MAQNSDYFDVSYVLDEFGGDVVGGGCHVKRMQHFEDGRGSLTVLIEQPWPSVIRAYYSITLPEQARDEDVWHCHSDQTDRFVVLHGAAMFGLSDGKSMWRVLIEGSDRCMLEVAPGIYHCFRTVGGSPCGLINFPTELYSPQDELRIPFSELEVEHPW